MGEVRPLLPPPAPTGRPRADDRKVLCGILYVLRDWLSLEGHAAGVRVLCDGLAEAEEVARGRGVDGDPADVSGEFG